MPNERARASLKLVVAAAALVATSACADVVDAARADIRELACRIRHADCADAARYRATLNAHCVDGRSVHNEEYLTEQLRLCDDEYRSCQ